MSNKINEKYYHKNFCLTFAGVVGSSKTPISNYLSIKLSLPIFNNDALHTEVIEDLSTFNFEEYLRRRDTRLKEILKSNIPFIYDASVDRRWADLKKQLNSFNYHHFIISLDLSKKLLIQLYQVKKYFDSLNRLDQLIQDHNNFLEQFSSDINLHITDKEFPQRLKISFEAVKKYLQ